MYSGLNTGTDAVLGEYSIRAALLSARRDTLWTLTARVNGLIEWVQEGTFEALDLSYNFDDRPTSDSYTVTLDPLDVVGC